MKFALVFILFIGSAIVVHGKYSVAYLLFYLLFYETMSLCCVITLADKFHSLPAIAVVTTIVKNLENLISCVNYYGPVPKATVKHRLKCKIYIS